MLMLRIEVLAKDVPLLNKTVYNITYTSSWSPPGNDYFIASKYQSDLSQIPCLFHLMLLGAVASVSVELDYHNRFFRSNNFNITGQGYA
jgi:hypothetical protein